MNAEKLEFKAEVREVLDLVIHSLYSHKEIFLRELISNASDAIDRARYESLTNSTITEEGGDWRIEIRADKTAGTLTVSDNGIGMAKEEIVDALGTIARSGTREFLRALKERNAKDNPELIGQFGVGFYSSFMVADAITVITKKAGQKDGKAVRWESSGEGSFTVEEVVKDGRGTDVILHIKDEEKKYLEEWEIGEVVRKYSDFIEHPIVMEVERTRPSSLDKSKTVTEKEELTLNSMKALWLRDKSEITPDEYNQFYKHVAHDFSEPLEVIHYRAEGTSEFTALLYIPSTVPSNILFKDYKMGPMLYVKRVQIMEHCEALLPPYLRFVRGVVDSSDLPLNVSREMLQNNRQVEIIKSNITRKVLDVLAEMKEKEADEYRTFYDQFARILKEGIYFDFARRETIADLLLYPSTKTTAGDMTSLAHYVEHMKEGQGEIYYVTGPTLAEALASPYLEAFRDKEYEVLVMTDEIDDFIMNGFEYKGKKLKSVSRGDVSLGADEKEGKEKRAEKYGKLLDMIKDQLKDDVKDVRLSGRLTDSAVCLVTDEGDLDPQMERMLKAMGQDVPDAKRILEINPDHPLLEAMGELFAKESDGELLREYILLLYDQALVLEGSRPKDAARFTRTMAKLMVERAAQAKPE